MSDLPYPEAEYTVSHREAADYLGVTVQTMYAMSARGLSVRKVREGTRGGRPHNYYHPSELEALKEKRGDRPYRTELSELEIEVAIRMYNDGKGLLYCRKMLGVGIARLYDIFTERGVEIRQATRPDQR